MVVFFIVTESSLKFKKTKLKKKKSFQINKRKFCSGQTLYGLITEDALCIFGCVCVRACCQFFISCMAYSESLIHM